MKMWQALTFLLDFLRGPPGRFLTKDEVADLLERFLDDQGDDWEFDDFISCSQLPEIEPYSCEIAVLPDIYPPPGGRGYCGVLGLQRIKEIVIELRMP